MKVQRIIDRLYDLLTLRPVYHAIFWLTLFGLMVWLGCRQNHDLWFVVGNELISLSFFAVLVYFNLFYLIPNYLARNVLLYLGLVLAACAVETPVKVLVLYLKFSGRPQLQEDLVAVQDTLYIGSFLVTMTSTVLRVITDWWRYQREKQNLQTQTIQSELRFLKNQINPHFLFNNLSVLSSLIYQNQDKAVDFVNELSKVYRYVLDNKNAELISLQEELAFLNHYTYLLKIRFEKAVSFTVNVEEKYLNRYFPPMCLQLLVENTIQHNEASQANPLRVDIYTKNDALIIENNIQLRSDRTESTKTGLNNIQSRYAYYADKKVEISDNGEVFRVTLPLMTI